MNFGTSVFSSNSGFDSGEVEHSLTNFPTRPSSPISTYAAEALPRPARKSSASYPRTMGKVSPKSVDLVPSFQSVLKKTECRALLGFLFMLLLLYVIIVTLLEKQLDLNLVAAGLLEENTVQSTSLEEGETNVLALEVSPPGVYFATGRASFDGEIGQFDADVVLEVITPDGLEITTPDGTFEGIADKIWEVRTDQSNGEFALAAQTLFQNKATEVSIGYNKVEDTLDVDTVSTREFISMIGDGVFVSMEAGRTYTSTVFNSEGDSFTSYFGTRSGEILANGLDATDRDISSRAIFTPSSDGDFLFRMRGSNIQVVTEDVVSAKIRIEEIEPTVIEVENDGTVSLDSNSLKIGASDLYEIELSVGVEYQFTVSSTLTIENELIEVGSLETDDSIFFLPRFLPGVSLTLMDKTSNNFLMRGSSQLAFTEETNGETNNKNRVEVGVSEEGDFNLVFSPTEDTTVLLDLLTLKPDFEAEQADEQIGEYDIAITSRQLVPVAPALVLADPNDPFGVCEFTGIDFVLRGCNEGVYLFCRQLVFPFQSVKLAPEVALEGICECIGQTCPIAPPDSSVSGSVQPIIAILRLLVTIIAIIMLLIASYALVELFIFADFRRRTIEQHNLYSWILCYISFALHAAHGYIDFSIRNVGDQFTELASAFEQDNGFTDPDFYDIDTFPELSNTDEPQSPPPPFLNEEALDVFQGISLADITAAARGLFLMQLLLMFVTFLIALDGWTHRISLTTASTYIKKLHIIEQKRKRMIYVRLLQWIVLVALFAKPFQVVFRNGEGYNNYIFFVASAVSFALAAFLFQSRTEVIRMIVAQAESSVGTLNSETNRELHRMSEVIRESTIGAFFSLILMGISFLYVGLKTISLADLSFQKENEVYEMFDTYTRFGELFLTLTMYRFLHLNHNALKETYIKAIIGDTGATKTQEVSTKPHNGQVRPKAAMPFPNSQTTSTVKGSRFHSVLGLGYPFLLNREFIRSTMLPESTVLMERSGRSRMSKALKRNGSQSSLFDRRPKNYIESTAVDDIL